MPTQIKFISKNGMHVVTYKGREHLFTKLHDALQYIFYLKFIALVDGQPISYKRNDTLYPVYSLTPPVVERVAKFYDLGEEKI